MKWRNYNESQTTLPTDDYIILRLKYSVGNKEKEKDDKSRVELGTYPITQTQLTCACTNEHTVYFNLINCSNKCLPTKNVFRLNSSSTLHTVRCDTIISRRK